MSMGTNARSARITLRAVGLAGACGLATALAGAPLAHADGPISVTTNDGGVQVGVQAPVGNASAGVTNTSSGQDLKVNAYTGLISSATVNNTSSGQTITVGTSTGGMICTCVKVTVTDVAGQPPITIAHNP
jgi:hypothetical protein